MIARGMLFESYVVEDKDATHILENLNVYCGVQEAISAGGSTIIHCFEQNVSVRIAGCIDCH